MAIDITNSPDLWASKEYRNNNVQDYLQSNEHVHTTSGPQSFAFKKKMLDAELIGGIYIRDGKIFILDERKEFTVIESVDDVKKIHTKLLLKE